jgi:hypothetical protein
VGVGAALTWYRVLRAAGWSFCFRCDVDISQITHYDQTSLLRCEQAGARSSCCTFPPSPKQENETISFISRCPARGRGYYSGVFSLLLPLFLCFCPPTRRQKLAAARTNHRPKLRGLASCYAHASVSTGQQLVFQPIRPWPYV